MKKKPSAAAKASSKAKPKAATKSTSKPKQKAPMRPAALVVSRSKPVSSASAKSARNAGAGRTAELEREVAELRAHIVAIRRLRAYAELSMIGEIVDLNDNFAQLMGHARGDLLGRNITSFMDANWQRSEARGFWDQLARGESVAGRYLLQVAGGREICMQANFNPVVASGELLHIALYATDVTDQARQMADYAGQVQAIGRSQAVIHFTLDGHILEANDNFLAATGYSLDEIVGQHHRMFVDPVERSSAEYKTFWEKLGRGEYDAGQYRRVAKGGRELWLQASYNAILDSSGKPVRVVKYASDITAQWQASQALTAAVQQTQGVVTAAGTGDLSQRIPLEGKNGMIRSLCEGVNTMLDDIEAATRRERVQAAEMTRIKQGLDVVATNVMVADADLDVVYVNESIKKMLAEAEADIRKDVPTFVSATVVGTNIDVFHKNPAHQRGMLARLRDTHSAKLVLGGRHFSLLVSPIDGADGQRLGYVVEWKDQTAELAAAQRERQLAAEMARIKQGLDVVATNVMVADANLDVVYVNESIKKMLAEAEADIRKDVPAFSAASVVGTNIDRFHKTPSRQREMLARLDSSFNTRLNLGGRSFSLIVNPIRSEAGERLGFVVEWKDITAELAQREIDAENEGRMAAISKVQAIIEFEMDGTIRDANENFLSATGYTLADIKGRHHSLFVEPSYRESAEYRQFWERLRRGEYDTAQYRRLGREGREVFLQASYNPILDAHGKPRKVVKYATDVTAQVLAARALQLAVDQTGDVVAAARDGDLARRVPLDGKSGAIRDLCDGINTLVDNMSGVIGEVGRVLGALAEGDLTQTIDADFQGAFKVIKDDSNRSVEQLALAVSQIKTATDTINVAAREIANGNNDLSARTEQQAASLEETASSMEELTSTVKQNAENAKQANQLAMGAADVARRGGQVVSEVVTTMSAINESSKKIVDIISVIDGIAFQTNILALNAAVEAARAGEQGRGFAVVAAEVRSLAQRSAAAAKEIKGLIGDSVEKVGNGSKLVEQAGRTMDEIVTSVKRVTDIMSEISAASQEQSQGIEQVNQTITQMDEVTQQNAALVEEASAAARSLEEQAAGLAESVSQFRLEEGGAAAAKPQPRVVASAAAPKPAVRPPAGKPAVAKPAPTRSNAAHSANGKSSGKSNGKAQAPAANGAEQWTEF